MPLIILAGIPLPVVNRNKGYLPNVTGWQISLIPSRESKIKANLYSCWKEVLSAADGADDHGAHIFGFHDRESDFPDIRQKLHDRHRLIWMHHESINNYGTDTFTKEMQSLAEFEDIWRKHLMPGGVDAAHLLPESSFTPINCRDIWRRVRLVSASRDDVTRIASLLAQFRSSHYHRGAWRDDHKLRFRAASERHGLFDQYGHRKFSYRLPKGFHYNVTSEVPNREFHVTDHRGIRHRIREYTNVDCHGTVRGGR